MYEVLKKLAGLILHPFERIRRFYLLAAIAKILVPEYRLKWPQIGWWDDEWFNQYLIKFDELHGFNSDRRWMMHQFVKLTKSIPGDTAECGAYKGAGSYLILESNKMNALQNKWHFIFDSFEGLSKPGGEDGEYWSKGDLEVGLETTKNNLNEFDNVKYYKGWIPDRFTEVEGRRFSFVHIDVDLKEPTLKSLEFFYPIMNVGGVILFDDYGFTTCPGATKAIDNYFADKVEEIVVLSCGGGFIVKQ